MKNVLILLIGFVIVSCSSNNEGESTTLQPEAFKTKIDDGATILDVRTSDEYSTGHISDAINIDIKNPGFEENIAMLDKSKTYAVYCASGVRSGKAADLMREKGFTSVYTLEGGIKTWKEQNLPLE